MPDRRFGPSRRVRSRREFLEIQGKGRKLRSEHFLLAYRRATTSESRLGITVTTKVDKRAVKRNLLKRRVRELFRKNRASFAWPGDFVVIALTGATTIRYREVLQELFELGYRAKLIPRCDCRR